MYNTDFFIKTFDLKKDIVGGECSLSDSCAILKKFNSLISARPHVFNIETTSCCNMSCVFCQRTTDMRRKAEHMSMETFDRVLSQMTARTDEELARWNSFVDANVKCGQGLSEDNLYFRTLCKSVTLHGFGEPLIDPMLPERIEALTKAGIESYFSGNPCNIRLDFMRQLFEAGTGYIKLAVDSLDDKRAKELRGDMADFTNSYKKTCELLDLKQEMKSTSVIIMTMVDTSGDLGPGSEAARFMELWEDKDVCAYVKSLDNQWLLSNKNKGDEIQSDNRSHYAGQYCEFPWLSVTILTDGSVVPCTQDVNGAWTFGNVNEQSLEEIWNSDKYMQFREMHVTGEYPEGFMCSAKCDLRMTSDYLAGNESN